MIWVTTSWSQQVDNPIFSFNEQDLTTVLATIEKQFAITYSYVNDDVVSLKITLKKARYSLEDINAALEKQTQLKIIKIDERFYALTKSITLDIQEQYELNDVLVAGVLAKGINKSNQKFILYPQKVTTLPGITEADILLSLQQLPGVKSPNETATGLHVRGGTPDQNLILWDGIRLYHQGHLFGMISGINPNVDQTVLFYNKGTEAKYGERVASSIDIKTTSVIPEKVTVKAGVNALDANAYLQIPILKDKLGLQVSGRKSFTEWLQSFTFEQLANKVFQNTSFKDFTRQNEFSYQDFSAKLVFKPSQKSTFSISSVYIDNFLDFNNRLANQAVTNQSMTIRNQGYSAIWNYQFTEKWRQHILFHYSVYDFDYQKRVQFEENQFERFTKLNRIVDSGFEWNLSHILSNQWTIDYGYQISGNDVSHLLNSNNQNIGVDLSEKQNYSLTHGGYTTLKYEDTRWNIQTGARFNYFAKQASNSFEPRIFIQKKLFEHYYLQVSYERKSQLISQFREDIANDLSLENYIWSLSNRERYPIQRIHHITTGLIFKQNNWLLDIDLYYKTITGITTFTFGFANQVDTAIRAGEGFTRGLDFLLQKSTPTWRLWMTYSYQDAQNRFLEINNYRFFETNANIKHAFTLSYHKKWQSFSVAIGWFLHSGKPFSLLNENNEIATFNSERLDTYHRMDISAIYELYKSANKTIKMGFSIYNIYNNKVIISKDIQRVYENLLDYSQPRYRIQDFYSLGIMPNVFLKFYF